MSAAPQPEPDAWGLRPAQPDPPALNAEIGWTTEDEGPGAWEPLDDLPIGKFLLLLLVALVFRARYLLCRAGVHRWTWRRFRARHA